MQKTTAFASLTGLSAMLMAGTTMGLSGLITGLALGWAGRPGGE